MLWRVPYQPEVRHLNLPFAATIGGFSHAAFREVEVWRRLFAEAEIGAKIVFSEEVREDATAYFPPSVEFESPELWRPHLQALPIERSFAYVPGILVFGNPTEDVWEAMLSAAK